MQLLSSPQPSIAEPTSTTHDLLIKNMNLYNRLNQQTEGAGVPSKPSNLQAQQESVPFDYNNAKYKHA